jgi:transcriptional regulator with XRE-family HTH domain
VTLAEIAHRLGRSALEDVAATAKPNTILGWYRKLIGNKFDGSKFRRSVGRLERGRQNISLANIGRIARALKVKPLELLQGVKCCPTLPGSAAQRMVYFRCLVASSSLRVAHSLVGVRKSSPTANPFGLWGRQ